MVKQKILKARKYRRTENFCTVREKKLKNILSKIHFLLTPDREDGKVFENIPIIVLKKERVYRPSWWEPKYLHLKPRGISVVLALNQNVKFVNILPKHICLNHHLRSTYIPSDNEIWIALSKNVVHPFTCVTCHKKYAGSTEEFRSRFNNYRCAHRSFSWNKKVNQESFRSHFAEGLPQRESDWEVRLRDQAVSVNDLRRR